MHSLVHLARGLGSAARTSPLPLAAALRSLGAAPSVRGYTSDTPTPSKMRLQIIESIQEKDKDLRNVIRTGVTNQLWRARRKYQELEGKAYTADDHRVVEKTPMDSYTEAFLPFSLDKGLLEEYLTAKGTIRVGKIFEDLDALAGTIAYVHCDDHDPKTKPLTIVTASVDRIDLMQKLHPDRDYRVCGHVSHVGRSSMTIRIKVQSPVARTFKVERDGKHTHFAAENDAWDDMMHATFTMVALNPDTQRASEVSRLRPVTDEEKCQFEQDLKDKERRKLAAQDSLLKKPPTEAERLIIHDLYLEARQYGGPKAKPLPPGMKWMSDTILSSVRVCQPSERNIHHKIFGGFLMREAFELGWANAYLHSGCHPYFLSLDDVSFLKPVSIGSLLQLTSKVVYTPGDNRQSTQVRVTADVTDPKTGARETTNVFHFTFHCEGPVTRVLPHSYEESMDFVDGMRRLSCGKDIAQALRPELSVYY